MVRLYNERIKGKKKGKQLQVEQINCESKTKGRDVESTNEESADPLYENMEECDNFSDSGARTIGFVLRE